MKKVFKTKQAHKMQKLFAQLLKKAGNTNALSADNKTTVLSKFEAELTAICGARQAETIMAAVISPGKDVDCLTVCAMGETLQYIRKEIRQAVRTIKQAEAQTSVVSLDAERAKIRMDDLMVMYWLTMKSFYAHYNRCLSCK